MDDEKLDLDFANLAPNDPAGFEGRFGHGLHHAVAIEDEQVTGEVFHHPEEDAVRTTWELDWQPIETCLDGEVVMLDDGRRQLLGRREMGMWMELTAGDELGQPRFQPMLWSFAPEKVKYDFL